MELKGKNVVLTGASSGIGLELLGLLLAEGCRVAACARHIENIKIQNENLFTFRCDTSKKEELDAFFGFAEEKLGQKTHLPVKSVPLCQRREPRVSVHVQDLHGHKQPRFQKMACGKGEKQWIMA